MIVDKATTWHVSLRSQQLPPGRQDERRDLEEAPVATTTWKIDPSHTDVMFSAKHMMVTTVRGKFDEVDGTITLDESDPTSAFGEFTVAVASLSTGFGARDTHLRSPDFFDAASYPTFSLRTTAVEHQSGDAYRVTADVTIRDVTRAVVFDVKLLGFYQGFQGRRVGFEARGRINREDWGLNWNMALESGGWLVGKEIRLEIDVAADEVTEAASETVATAA